MIKLAGYQILEKIYEGSRTSVYRAYRELDEKSVVIKVMSKEYPTFNELLQFRHQYTISKNLNLPGIIKPLCLEKYRNGYALVMEDIGAISLREYATNKQLSLSEILTIAISVVETLGGLHQNRVIHKDIKLSNIVINPVSLIVRLIDFSIADSLPRESQELKNPNILEGTLAYMSQEQTGRMNRGIDYRSDFYSLGVSFYELLTGKLPFQSDDPMELAHCHIAKVPTPPSEIKPEIPLQISDLVMKLMAKSPEERYQSAVGLRLDLETCLKELSESGSISNFKLGTRDVCNRFIIPEKLYGRETEVQTLLAAFERISNPPGKTEMMLVAGISGIGKTAVVNEIHKPIIQKRGYFIKGKFDQFNRDIPFSALVQAFSNLVKQLLTETAFSVEQWKTKILEALSEQAQVIIDVIPELEILIGKQLPVAESAAKGSQNRFDQLFQKLIRVFASATHPLVIFLDDLQWADAASLKLINRLLSDRNIEILLLIGAYRDNEVSPNHALILTLEELKKTGAIINKITLNPLDEISLNILMADALNCSLELAKPLTKLIYNKTQGHPLFTGIFLKSLYKFELIKLDVSQGYWQCDFAKFRTMVVNSDLLELMITQLQKLPDSTKNVLKIAACLGNQFNLKTLSIVCEKSPTKTATDIGPALQEGLVVPENEVYKFEAHQEVNLDKNDSLNSAEKSVSCCYRFLHNQVQQAAYLLIPEDQKESIDLQIGQLLLKNSSPETQKENIFEIVNHLNIGADLITEQREQNQLAQLNLIAGQKAKAATAYPTAIQYFKSGLNFLPLDSWQNNYDLTLALHQEATEVAFLNGDFEHIENLLPDVLSNAKNILDTTKIYEVKIQVLVAKNQFNEAMNTAREVLKSLGLEL